MNFAKKRSPGLEMTVILLIAGTGFGLASCSSDRARTDRRDAVTDVRTEVRRDTTEALNAEDKATFVTEVSFDKGSALLKGDSKEKLDSLVTKAKQTGNVDDIKIISWADMAYPATSKKDLPDSQQKLAEKRIENIKDYIKHDNSFDIDTFNMARQPSKVSVLFNTENARVKRSLSNAGVSETGIADKTGKAMVLVILKDVPASRDF